MDKAKSSRPSAGVSHALLELARPHWKRFLIIAGLALLALLIQGKPGIRR